MGQPSMSCIAQIASVTTEPMCRIYGTEDVHVARAAQQGNRCVVMNLTGGHKERELYLILIIFA